MSNTTKASQRLLNQLMNKPFEPMPQGMMANMICHQAASAVLAQANLSQQAVFELLRH